MVAMLVVLGACKKATPAEPTAATRETAAIALGTQSRAVKFTTHGKDKEVLVIQFPPADFEPCEPRALEAMVRMQPDPEHTIDHPPNRDSHVVSTGDLAKDTRPLTDMFKTEVTQEMRARMEEARKLVSQFRRIECETRTGQVIGLPIP